MLAELAAHLLDDRAAGAADGLDRERGEQADHQPAEQQADQHGRFVDAEGDRVPKLGFEFFLKAGEQHDRREHRGADRVALRDGLRRVPDRVEPIGDFAHLLGQIGHLGDPTRVVGDRAEGVERDDQARQREQAHGGDADPVDAGHAAARELPGAEHPEHDHDRRQRGRLQPRGEALDDVRCVTGDRRFRGLLHRREAGRGVVFGYSE